MRRLENRSKANKNKPLPTGLQRKSIQTTNLLMATIRPIKSISPSKAYWKGKPLKKTSEILGVMT
jgi:hypothetical protein